MKRNLNDYYVDCFLWFVVGFCGGFLLMTWFALFKFDELQLKHNKVVREYQEVVRWQSEELAKLKKVAG